MRLTKAQLRADLRTVTAQHRVASAALHTERVERQKDLLRLADMQAKLDALRAEPRAAGPALADNVRLAHHLEQAEHELAQLRAVIGFQDARLARFMAEHPDIFDTDRRAS